MIQQSSTSIVVGSTLDAPAAEVFAVLADPRRHLEIDGSGMLRPGADSVPITAAGQVFTMEMHYPSLGDYRTENHVVDFVAGRSIAWMTAREGQVPAGVRWSWQLEPLDDGRTAVVHTYDWSQVTDPAVLARVSFPRVSAAAMQETVQRLAQAAVAGPR
jgi:uncharacterized protein YndB with AHSA1/START domain